MHQFIRARPDVNGEHQHHHAAIVVDDGLQIRIHHGSLGAVQSKHERVQDDTGCENDTCLEATTGAEVAVKLYVECK